jgi:hypothetical protein
MPTPIPKIAALHIMLAALTDNKNTVKYQLQAHGFFIENLFIQFKCIFLMHLLSPASMSSTCIKKLAKKYELMYRQRTVRHELRGDTA